MKKVNKKTLLGILAVLAVIAALLIPVLPVEAGTGYSPITVWLGTSSVTVSAGDYATLLASYSVTITGTYNSTNNFNYTGVPIYRILEFAFPEVGSLTGYSVLTADSTNYLVIYGPNVIDNTLVKGNDNLIIATSGTVNGTPGTNFPRSACSTFTAGNRFNNNVATIRLQYAIQAPTPTGGQIVPASGWYSGSRNPWQNSSPPALGVDYNANQQFNIVAASGYHVTTLTVDGGTVTPTTSYTFSNVTASHTLAATFAPVSIYIDPASQAVSNGASFTVDLDINASQQSRGWQTNVDFDAAKMQFTGVTEGSFLKGYALANPPGGTQPVPGPVIDNVNGHVTSIGYYITQAGTGGPTGTGTLCTLSFTAKAGVNDYASITPSGVVVSDTVGVTIPGTIVTGGTVLIGTEPKPDLVVTEKHEDWVVAGGSYTITYTIKNQGNAAAGASTTSIVIDNGAPITVGCGALVAGASDTQATAVQTFTGPTDTVVVTADSTHVVAESNETNNARQNMLSYYGSLAGVAVDVTGQSYTAHASVVDEVVNPAVSYDPLTFVVKVTNTGLLDDKYELTVTDQLGWTLKLDPSELFVMAADPDNAEYAALSVSVPQDTLGNVSNQITVKATGKMATDEGVVIGPVNACTITVTTQAVNSVQIELLPGTIEPQTGAPGSPISWLVVVKNTGNVDDSFNLAVSESLTGVSSQSTARTSWGATFSSQPGTIPAFTKWASYLKVTVPADAKTSESNELTVTITGNGPSDTYVVKAQALEPGPRIPEGVVEITVEDEIVSISCLGVNSYPFGAMKENETASTGEGFFVIRNTGNVSIDISVRGQDALTMPGEPSAKWGLSNSADLDQYAMQLSPKTSTYGGSITDLTTGDQEVWSAVPESQEVRYGLTIVTPTAITTPARMWMRITISAIAS